MTDQWLWVFYIIENELLNKIYIGNITDQFASLKARKLYLLIFFLILAVYAHWLHIFIHKILFVKQSSYW